MSFRRHPFLDGTDVIGILDISGNIVVRYKYDAWGNCTTTTANYDIAEANPFRYRSYYYDEDTGLYYLNARYYNPKWRRFISPDSSEYIDPESVNGLNLYAYCGNEPINRFDPFGYDWDWNSFWQGLGYLATGIGAIIAGSLVIASGVATWPMLLVAGITIGAGALTTINGASEIVEAGTGYNFIEDTIFRGNSTAYSTYAKITGTVAAVGSIICGGWYKYNSPRIRAYKSLNSYNVKTKHLPGTAGNWSKFSSADQAYLRSLGKTAIKNTPMRNLLPNSSDSYKLLYDFAYAIGTKGETSIRLAFSYAGKIITFFPF